MGKKPTRRKRSARRVYSDELKAEAVQMLFDGHSAKSVAENLGLSGSNLLYQWKAKLLKESGKYDQIFADAFTGKYVKPK